MITGAQRITGTRCAGSVEDFSDGAVRLVRVRRRWVAVFRSGGRFFALEDRCPHEGTPLSAGRVEGGVVQCPSHALTFDLGSGLCTRNDVFRVRRYGVAVIRGRVWVIPGRQPPPWRPGGRGRPERRERRRAPRARASG